MPGENAIYTSRWYIPDVLHLAPEPTNAAGNSQSDNHVKSNLILVEDVGFCLSAQSCQSEICHSGTSGSKAC